MQLRNYFCRFSQKFVRALLLHWLHTEELSWGNLQLGDDSVEGLFELHQARDHTFVQDHESSIIFSMPNAGMAIGTTNQSVELEKIAAHLIRIARKNIS